MSNTAVYSVNDMVFVDNIGYGTLMDCGQFKSVSVKQLPTLGQKKQSIYFYPELFNSQFDLARQKSQQAIIVPQKSQQKKQEPKPNSPKDNSQKAQSPLIEQKVETKEKQQNRINIVKIRLEGSNALVYTPDTNIRKHVTVPVRPLFLPAIGTLNIRIDINKTIQNFKREIFQLLGLKNAHYFNVKLFTTTPQLAQLNIPGKHIWQCGLKQNSTLTMTAQHGFCFQLVPPPMVQCFSVTNNNLTFLSLPKKPKVVQNVVIALPAPVQNQPTEATLPPKVQVNPPKIDQVAIKQQIKAVITGQQNGTTPVNTEKKEEVKQKVQQKIQQKKQPEVKEVKQQPKPIQIPEILYVNGDKYIKSGRHYFEVRLDKLPQNIHHLQVGISAYNGTRKWLFAPLLSQKIQKQNQNVKLSQSYGMSFKVNDIIGVHVKIDKHKIMRVNFFKNNVNLGQCFEQKIQQICFVFGIGSQGQISLDTRAQLPMDSYRYR